MKCEESGKGPRSSSKKLLQRRQLAAIGLVDKGMHCYGAMSPIYEIFVESKHYTFMHLTNLVRMEIKLKSMEQKEIHITNFIIKLRLK
jgi:hypothetical protein